MNNPHICYFRWTTVPYFRSFILSLFFLECTWKIAGNLTTLEGIQECSEFECLKCNAAGCLKCQNYIKLDDRRCVAECPRGYMEQWSSVPDLMGRICRSSGYSDPMMATIIGSTIGSVICVLVLIFGMVLIRKKHCHNLERNSIVIVEESVDREDFLKQLKELRPNAQYFLTMLNDTRYRIRKLYLTDNVASNSQLSTAHDLAKLLILLNKPIQLIVKPPNDWNRLYLWAQRLLDRRKPEIGHLIDFLQDPTSEITDCRLASSQYSTFKSTNTTNTAVSSDSSKNLQQMQLFGSLISLHEFEDPRSSNLLPPRNSCSTLKSNYSSTDIHNSSLWLEDEFFKLGLRPQDEITTEL